jgi:hypothetical protein
MLIKIDPIEDDLRKNMFKLGFRQSPKPSIFPKPSLKKKLPFLTPEYFLKLSIKDLLMPHALNNLPHDFMLEIESGWKSSQLPPFTFHVAHPNR